MILLSKLIIFYLQIFFASFFIITSGFLLRKIFINENYKTNILEDGFYGFVLIGFISLSLNFFFPLNPFLNSIAFLVIFIFSIQNGFFLKINKNDLFKKLLIISLISFLLVIYSTVNRPDAWLYHLPYSKIINEHKIIIGVANIHERFAHISIFQYISSFFNNYFFFTNGILIPISLVTSFFFVYVFYEYQKSLKINYNNIYTYSCFLFLIISLYTFNRYSEFGNDAQPHIYYYFFSLILIKSIIDKDLDKNFKELCILSLFLFLMKPTFIFVALIPFIIFLYQKRKKKIEIILSRFSILFFAILLTWILKNFFNSGCLVYPALFSCFDELLWNSSNLNENILVNEAWSKGWPDFSDQSNSSYSEYISNFNWLNTWFSNHFLFVLEKISPLIILILINCTIFIFTKNLKKKSLDKKYYYFLLFSFIFVILWFLKFPVYRLGLSQIYIFIVLTFLIFFVSNLKINFISKYKIIFNSFISILIVIIITKNLVRINQNFSKEVFPEILANINLVKVFDQNNKFTHYSTIEGQYCGYSSSPCTNYNKDLNLKFFLGYKIYYQN